jgi:hypothetical protein
MTYFAQGYFCGGENASNNPVATTDLCTYSTDTTTVQTTANLGNNAWGAAGVSDCTDGKGFVGGGATAASGNATKNTSKITYSNNVGAAASTANLINTGRWGLAGVSDNTDGKGYMLGGHTGASGYFALCDKVTYSSEITVSQTTANLSVARYNLAGLSDNKDGKGYCAGGVTGAVQFNNADKLTFASDTTAAQTTANLSQSRSGVAGVTDDTDGKGYCLGGTSGANVTKADLVTYSTDTTAAQTTANLSQARSGVAGLADAVDGKGYIAGGLTSTAVTTADRLIFSTNITSAKTTAKLSVARQMCTPLSGNDAALTSLRHFLAGLGVGG